MVTVTIKQTLSLLIKDRLKRFEQRRIRKTRVREDFQQMETGKGCMQGCVQKSS